MNDATYRGKGLHGVTIVVDAMCFLLLVGGGSRCCLSTTTEKIHRIEPPLHLYPFPNLSLSKFVPPASISRQVIKYRKRYEEALLFSLFVNTLETTIHCFGKDGRMDEQCGTFVRVQV